MMKYFLIYRHSFFQTLQKKGFLISKVCLYIMASLIFISLWSSISSEREPTLLSFEYMSWYILITELIVLSTSEIYTSIHKDIKSGAIAYFLTKPVSYIWVRLSEAFGETVLNLIVLLFAGITFGVFTGAAIPNLTNLPFLLFAITLSAFLLLIFQSLVGVLSYWLGDTFTIVLILNKILFVLGGLFVPITIYPQWLQNIANLTPFPYMLYYTASILQNSAFHASLICLALCGWTAALSTVTLFFYKKMLKTLEVAGG